MTVVARKRAANWRSWDGRSGPPVKGSARVSVMLRNGFVLNGRADEWCWTYEQGPDLGDDPEEIVAFRVKDARVLKLRTT